MKVRALLGAASSSSICCMAFLILLAFLLLIPLGLGPGPWLGTFTASAIIAGMTVNPSKGCDLSHWLKLLCKCQDGNWSGEQVSGLWVIHVWERLRGIRSTNLHTTGVTTGFTCPLRFMGPPDCCPLPLPERLPPLPCKSRLLQKGFLDELCHKLPCGIHRRLGPESIKPSQGPVDQSPGGGYLSPPVGSLDTPGWWTPACHGWPPKPLLRSLCYRPIPLPALLAAAIYQM